jgi:hypothetical protein
MDEYLILDYTDRQRGEKPKMERVCGVKELLARLDLAKEQGHRIAVHEIGKLLLDWS